MEKYLGIGFVILCLAILVGIIGIVQYQFHIDKEKVDISSGKTNTNNNFIYNFLKIIQLFNS